MKVQVLSTWLVLTLAASWVSAASLDHVVEFDEADLSLEEADGYGVIRLRGGDVTREPGLPELPAVPVTVALPPGARVVGVEVLSAESTELMGRFLPRPAQHPRILPAPGMDFPVPPVAEPDPSVYQGRDPYPREIAALTSTGRLGDVTLAGLTLHPVQFLPSAGKLRFFKSISLRIHYEREVSPARRAGAAARVEVAQAISDNRVPGPAQPGASNETRLEPGEYEHVIIVPDSGFEGALAPLAEWKTTKGVPSTIVYATWILATYPGSDDAERVRNFVSDANSEWGAVWFLLAGDTEHVPTRRAYAMTSEAGGHADEDAIGCDAYFSDLDGTWNADGDGIYGELSDEVDMYPDVFVGRAPLNTLEDAHAFTAKVVDYERSPLDDYQLDMLMAAEVLWTDPFTDSGIALNRIDRDYVPPRYDPIMKLYETLGNESGESVTAAINAGKGHFLHSGHAWFTVMGCGDGSIYRWEIPNLTNARREPLVYSIGCWPAAFDLTEACIAERFLQNPHGGAVAFIGNSRYGWASPGNPGYGYSERFMQEFYRVLFVDGIREAGAALATAKARLIPFSQQENVYRWHQYQLNLLGDPEMPVWTGQPALLTVTHPDSVVPGQSVLDVLVRASGVPVEGALVCAANRGDVYERGTTSSHGTVSLSIDTVLPDSLSITVTAGDCRPYEGAIPVVFSGAFLRPVAVDIDDSMGGNGDGLPGPGETAAISVQVMNFGTDGATGVEATLTSADPMVDVLDGHAAFGDIGGGAVAVATSPCEIFVSPYCPNGHAAVLDVAITATGTGETWTGHVELTVAAPSLAAESYSLDDVWGGDGDGFAEPGETVRLMVGVRNSGLANASSPVFTLASDDPSVTVVSGVESMAEVAAGELAHVVFEIEFAADCPTPGFPELTLETLTADGFESTGTVRVAVGSSGFAHDFESGASGWTHGGTTDAWHLTDHRTNSGTASWYVGIDGAWAYSDGLEAWLDSPEFVRGPDAEVSFWCWYEFPIYHEDGFYVEVLSSGAPIDTLDFIGSGGALDLLGSIGNDWMEYRYGLPGESGDTLQVRFRFTSDAADAAEGVYIDDVFVTASDLPADTGAGEGELPEPELFLYQNHPNPFSPSTLITFALTADADIELAVYNVQGRLIRTLVSDSRSAGEYEVVWDGKDEFGIDVAAGVYLYRLRHEEVEETRKMILVR